jgi:hypothetical protein
MKLLILLLLALPATGAQAEIYACQAKSGLMIYQNFPCPFDSLGSVPQAAAQPGPSPQAATSAPAVSKRMPVGASPPGVRRDAAVPAKVTAEGQLRIGSSEDDVRRVWGEPEEVVQDEPPKGRVEIWRYKDGRSVQIDRRHLVVAIQL